MTATYRALVIHGTGDLRIDTLPSPERRPDQAEVAVTHGGICGSDLHYLSHGAAGESILKGPMVLGHEVVGRVQVAAADGSGPAMGTPVAIFPATPCGHCEQCVAGHGNVCPTTTYLGSAARFPHTDGAFAERYTVAADRLLPLPAGLDLATAALVEPASVAWHAVSQAGTVAGKRVLVVGAGPIGALVVAVLVRAGAADIVVTDVHPRPLQIATELGATATHLAADFGEVAASLDADIAIDSSGSVPGVASAVRGLRRRGHLVLLGLLPAGQQPFPVSQVITRELTVAGSFRFHSEMQPVIDALADGSLRVGPVASHQFPLDRAGEAFTVAADAASSGKVLITFGATDPAGGLYLSDMSAADGPSSEAPVYTGHADPQGPPVTRVLPDITISKLSVGSMDNNAYLLVCRQTGDALLIDAADDSERIADMLGTGPDRPRLRSIVTTHSHPDHWQALGAVAGQTGANLYAGAADAGDLPVPTDVPLGQDDVVPLGAVQLRSIALRGHTPGSVALLYRDGQGGSHLFTGDSLFPGGPGRTRSPEDFTSLMDDLTERVFDRLPDDTWVYPGHGDDTTLGRERPHLAEWRARGW